MRVLAAWVKGVESARGLMSAPNLDVLKARAGGECAAEIDRGAGALRHAPVRAGAITSPGATSAVGAGVD